MQKIRLELDALAVESFETGEAGFTGGTVRANQDPLAAASAPNPCLPETYLTCPRRQPLYASCVANCECTTGIRACLVRPDV